ncbi:CLUMA_CG014118, isoform A [Clunio marinus]|uniref:Insulin-degrading enzyme n=1 Tax=Clunio marinus TaxID=568069 RepID=A0A1J1IKW6_9DIPT|nr:CLUMA_CG014118, isoform A [Clunio marinus]
MGIYEHKLRFKRRPLLRHVTSDESRDQSPELIIENVQTSIRFNNIIKSEQDMKSYRVLVLENGMKVLLISDLTTDKSAACMCIEVGHMNDPVEVSGLAHLTEHALFLGTEKYPNENEFRAFVSENGGITNAQTFADVTKYFFDVVPEKLSDALDRFSQMFIAPLFCESSVLREISAVNGEHEKNLDSDAWRVRMVNKTLANANHPYSKFSTGCKNSLLDRPKQFGIDIINELISFHNEWYRSGNLMNLAIVGKNSLDELEQMVCSSFVSGIENKNVNISHWSEDVFLNDQMMTKTYIEPIMDVRSLTISFPTPDFTSYYKSKVRELDFRFEDYISPLSLVRKVVSSMRHYPLPEVLSAPVVITEWQPDLIERVLKIITPENMRLVVVDKSFSWKCRQMENIYGTRFGTEMIPKSTLKSWIFCGFDKSLQLPQQNLFIPSNFDFLPISNWKQTYPKIIRDTSLVRVWFKQDIEFRKPKSIMSIELKNPTINCDPLNWNLTHLFVWLLDEHLKQQMYMAELAGLEYRIAVTTSGIRIYIDGYSDKQDIFLEMILKEIFRFKIDIKRFEDIYDSYLSDLKSFTSDKPQQVAIYHLNIILTEQMWTDQELIASMKFCNIGRLKTFMKEVLTQTHAECFIYGNVNEDKALQLSSLVEDRLSKARNCSPTKSSKIFIPATLTLRERKLSEGIHHVYQAVSYYHKLSCTSFYIQCGIQDDKSNVLLDLVLQMLKEPFFNVLRTQEQQGYLVDCLVRRANGTQGIKFVVESSKHLDYIAHRIENFLTSMAEKIETMSRDKFESFKKVLKVKKLPNTLTLTDQFWDYFKEISSQQYHFNRANVEASILRNITLEDVSSFYKTFISRESPTRRSISIHVTNKSEDKIEIEPQTLEIQNVVKIKNISDFQSSLQLFPLIRMKNLKQFYSKKK